MKKINFKIIIIYLLLVFTGFVSWKFYFQTYVMKDTVDIHQFPATLGEWTSEELTITEEEYKILETRNVFARKYLTKTGKAVVLYIIYSQNNRKVSHPPELCYTGGGISILEKQYEPIKLPDGVLDVTKMLMEQREVQQYVYYWFKVGSSFTPNYWKQQAIIATKSLLGQPASSALVRVSAYIVEGDAVKA
ncbi:MAG: EpsI family protein, partial [Candidatus Omnitrophota bacterium]